MRAQRGFSLFVALSAIFALTCACGKVEMVTADPSFIAFQTEEFRWERAVCDVCPTIRDGRFRGDFLVEDLSAFSFVLCLTHVPADAERETCRQWLEREMSKHPWASLKRVYDEIDLLDLAEWKVAVIAAPNEEYRRRNPPPSRIRRLKKNLEVERRLDLGWKFTERELARSREDWRQDQTWRKVSAADYGRKGREIATLQQQIMAMKEGYCPFCCVHFAVSFPEKFEITRLRQALRETSRAWFIGLGGGSSGHLENWIGRIWKPRYDYCNELLYELWLQ